MTDAVLVTIAEAVKEKLKAANLSPKFCPERSYCDWSLEPTDAALHVDVVAHTTMQTAELGSRGDIDFEVPVSIAVRKKFTKAQSNEETGRIRIKEIDELAKLVEDVWWVFRPQNLEDFTAGEWTETKIIVNPDRASLVTPGMFLGVVRITFRYEKAA